jgi:tRNA 5-methylaminomethyl-2-thiouridine biosynthesis bifunctional protein
MREDLEAALRPFAELRALAARCAARGRRPIGGFHRIHFEGGRVALTLILGEVGESLPQLEARADALFLDGFAPARNPAMWSPEWCASSRAIAAPGATLATWTVAGGVRTALADAGFSWRSAPGSARSARCWWAARGRGARSRRIDGGGRRRRGPRGNAGRRAARRARVGCVHVDERASVGAPRGLVRPIANLRDAVNAQASRSAFLYALQHYRRFATTATTSPGIRAACCSSREDADEEARFETIARSQGYPPEFLATWTRRAPAKSRAARSIGEAGGSHWGRRVDTRPCRRGARTRGRGKCGSSPARKGLAGWEREGAGWRGARRRTVAVIAEAPVLVVANAADASRLLPEARCA